MPSRIVRVAPASRCVWIGRSAETPGQHRSLTDGVSELKIDFGPGYRVYYTERGGELIVLLAGGDKSTQQQDIKLAIALARSL